jgi:hypothetical protein
MKRRDLLRNITLTTFGIGVTATGMNAHPTSIPESLEDLAKKKKKKKPAPGRTPEEVERDAKLLSETFFTPQELATITALCDIILPADATSGSASQAGVPAFIEFMAKDRPDYQTPLRGGLMWLNNQMRKRFGKPFVECTAAQQLQVVDEIAYPEQAKPAMTQGVSFFNLLRDLTMTGFYTTEMGFRDLGYLGNQANVWTGVPKDVLAQYGLSGND